MTTPYTTTDEIVEAMRQAAAFYGPEHPELGALLWQASGEMEELAEALRGLADDEADEAEDGWEKDYRETLEQ
jgi:phosphoglycolate phosphatase-like HAD superfamily hydrolase